MILRSINNPSDKEIDYLFSIEKFTSPATPISLSLSRSQKNERAFSLLEAEMREALDGRIDPAVYVMNAPCGTGKSTTVQKVLGEWKLSGFHPGSVIIFVATYDEIEAYVRGAGLDHDDYAICTSDPLYASYGRGMHHIDSANVLFVTHVRAEKDMRAKSSFEAMSAYFYKGKPRTLRVWDEGFAAAVGATFNRDDLYALSSAFKGLDAVDRAMFNDLWAACIAPKEGMSITIPLALAGVAERVLQKKLKGWDGPTKALAALGKLAGSKAFIRDARDGRWSFVGAGRSLSADIAPLFVLDASARLTDRYDQLPAHGMKVVRLEPATIDYQNLVVRICNLAAGKAALSNETTRTKVFGIIADLANSKPDESFLIVMAKEFCGKGEGDAVTLPTELAAKLNDASKVRIVNWGRHKGSNEFRDVQNVIIVSSHAYTNEAYEAMALADSGSIDGIASSEDVKRVRENEFMQNLYQGVCRGNVRNQESGICGSMNAYLIMRDSSERRNHIKTAFPGCMVEDWRPIAPKKKGQLDMAMRVLLELLDDKNTVSKKELVAACGGSGPSYLTKVYRDQRFIDFCAAHGILMLNNGFHRYGLFKLAA